MPDVHVSKDVRIRSKNRGCYKGSPVLSSIRAQTCCNIQNQNNNKISRKMGKFHDLVQGSYSCVRSKEDAEFYNESKCA